MYNDIVTIGSLTIHGYGLMIGIGIVAALLVGDYRAKKKGLDGDLIYGLTLATVIFGFLSAKTLFILTQWKDFVEDPKSFLTGSGFVVFGGIIGGAITIMIYCRMKRMDFARYLDLMIPSVALAQGFGRIGCFLAGCCYGKRTDSWFGITFTDSHYAPNHVKLFPAQLVMSAGDFLIAALLLLYARRNPAKGKTGALYLMLYSVGRFFAEFTRNDNRGFVGALSTSQFIGIFIFLIGAVFFFGIIPARDRKSSSVNREKEAENED